MYLQHVDLRYICSRKITTVEATITLERQGAALVYSFMATKQVFFICQQQHRWITESLMLEGSGVLRNTKDCHVTNEGIQLYPTLTGETTFTGQVSAVYTPTLPSVISPSESLQL
jgi:hypothetical protein